MVAGLGVLTVSVAGCQSTEQESARIGREGAKLTAGPSALELGGASRSVRVSDVTLVSDAGRMAIALRLTNTSNRTQSNLPVLVTVRDTAGKTLYSNEAGGLEASLQRMALLRGHESAWWVDDQVLMSKPSGKIQVRVGSGTSTTAGAAGKLATSAPKIGSQSGLSVLSTTVTSGSATAQGKVPVFAVGLHGGRVVSAGRAVVGALPAHGRAPVQVFLVGNPAGAKIELNAVPTA